MIKVVFSKKYRIFYLITAFFTVRIWASLLAAIYFSSGNFFMEELMTFSSYLPEVTYLLFFLSIFFMLYEKIALKQIFSLSKSKNEFSYIINNQYHKYYYIVYALYLGVNFFLLYEAMQVGQVGSFQGLAKSNYIEFVQHPWLYKVSLEIQKLTLVCMAYIFAIRNLMQNQNLYKYEKKLYYFVLLLGFMFNTLFFGHLEAKSYIVTNTLLYFLSPIVFFNYIHKVKIFQNKIYLILFFVISGILTIIPFYMYYKSEIFVKIVSRLQLEGQLLFSSLKTYVQTPFISHSYLNSLIYNPDSYNIVYLMKKYLPTFRFENYFATKWTMSGAMPAYYFQFSDFYYGLIVWGLNLLLLAILLKFALKHFLKGELFRTYILLRLSWFVSYYVSLGDNYLFKKFVWILFVTYLFISIVSCKYKNKIIKIYEKRS